MSNCKRCGKSPRPRFANESGDTCICREFIIKIPDWYGDEPIHCWSYDAETAIEEFVEKKDTERDLLRRNAPLIVQVTSVQDDNPVWVWETFEVFAEATIEYTAYARE
jgi:hypothetical protein